MNKISEIPEIMMTYEPSQGLLFSGDAFGGFAALDDGSLNMS
jgi:flavorubredoxin